ncbi:hotdog family protein [Chitinophaga japonensis]|uniref:3-hydroxyacyl-[acyl-carrier-protein] dehydratase n=1 Tax=Chitinophaga japonensis TaxID=104662 RepID=A0A562T4A3_CHIJA|nr:3-hydroxyacyl-ACP dehydratase [Chitinophaga japonensis]TWI88367.1 3-hydroxyacyl-[acyl-carrier-protein] dehydratase [Chitinophaga japonensis]
MMLAGNFYTIVASEQTPETFTVSLALNAAHPIFEGHFPGQPVVPGVCMMQTIQELLEQCLQRRLLLQKAANMKFMTMINPVAQPQVSVTLQYALQDGGLVKTSAVIRSGQTVFMKFQGTFRISG